MHDPDPAKGKLDGAFEEHVAAVRVAVAVAVAVGWRWGGGGVGGGGGGGSAWLLNVVVVMGV